MPSVPSASTGTFMNQFTLLVMSRLPMPRHEWASRKLSTHACSWRVWNPYRSAFDSRLHAPPMVSWRSQLVAVMVIIGRPSLESSCEPATRKMFSWATIVSGAL